MRARVFALIVAVLFIAATVAGALVVGGGYGLPSRFGSLYRLDGVGLLIGVGQRLGEPVVYEWPVVALLRPGETRINITLLGFDNACAGGGSPVVIRLRTGGEEYSAGSTSLSVAVERDSMFLVLLVRVEFNSTCIRGVPPSQVLMALDIRVSG